MREVKLTGNEELSQDDLKEQIDVKPATILDLDAVRSNAKKIQEKYVEKGYFLAEVTSRLDPVEGGASGRRGLRHPRARQGDGEGDPLPGRPEGDARASSRR